MPKERARLSTRCAAEVQYRKTENEIKTNHNRPAYQAYDWFIISAMRSRAGLKPIYSNDYSPC
jgi:hypothetical protein